MAILRQFWTNFTGGELDPLLSSRVDTHAYANGAKTLTNVRILAQGGLKRRPGTKFISTLTGTSHQMEPFIFSDAQLYFFIFTASTLNVYNGTTGAAVVTVSSCPWTSAMISDLIVAQTANTMIVTHPDLITQKILRTGASTFTVTAFAFKTGDTNGIVYQPYHKFEADSLTFNPSSTSGNINVVSSSDYWVSAHVGQNFRIGIKQFTVNSITNATTAACTVRENFVHDDITSDWEEPAISSTRGYPRSCCFHSGRLVFGGTRDLPNYVFASKTSDYFNFDVGLAADDDSIQVQVLESQVSEITGVLSFRHLLIFTDNSELYSPTSASSPLTPSNVSFRRQTRYGTSRLQAKEFDEAVIFLSKGKKSLREFEYDDIKQAYLSPSVSLLSGHLIQDPIGLEVQTENDQGQESYAYILNTDGSLAVYMAMRNEKISSWSKWTTNGEFKNICSINGLVFAIVKRTIDSAVVYLLELFDSSLTLDAAETLVAGSATASWTGLDHLDDTVIKVVSGNYSLGSKTVGSDGSLSTSPDTFTTITAGLDYTPTITTLAPELQVEGGTSAGTHRRVVRTVLDLNESLDVSAKGTKLLIRNVNDDLSTEPSKVTGRKEFWMLGWDRLGEVTITQTEPLPLTVNGIMVELEF
jgi:hypothetical protein